MALPLSKTLGVRCTLQAFYQSRLTSALHLSRLAFASSQPQLNGSVNNLPLLKPLPHSIAIQLHHQCGSRTAAVWRELFRPHSLALQAAHPLLGGIKMADSAQRLPPLLVLYPAQKGTPQHHVCDREQARATPYGKVPVKDVPSQFPHSAGTPAFIATTRPCWWYLQGHKRELCGPRPSHIVNNT